MLTAPFAGTGMLMVVFVLLWTEQQTRRWVTVALQCGIGT